MKPIYWRRQESGNLFTVRSVCMHILSWGMAVDMVCVYVSEQQLLHINMCATSCVCMDVINYLLL